MTVTGKEADLRRFAEKASKPYTSYHKGVTTVDENGSSSYNADAVNEQVRDYCISFMNFVAPEDLNMYYGASEYNPEGYESWTSEERIAYKMKFSSDGWYDWNVRNWGTKWDACWPEITSNNPELGVLGYRFETAWSPAEKAFRKMAEQHPELTFEFYCEEEQGWGVEFKGQNGRLSIVKEWSIPDSHQDWENMGRECPLCAMHNNVDDFVEPYDDCPGKHNEWTVGKNGDV
jgi:hypothetical protein